MRGVSDGPAGEEPDYRMSLAAERTYLAYIRTAMALLAGGVAVVVALPEAEALTLRRIIGVLLVVMGAATAGTAYSRWRSVDAAMRSGRPLPRSRTTVALATGMTVAAALALAVVLTG
jgi:putative membrane protein